jgi:hypothetical protein
VQAERDRKGEELNEGEPKPSEARAAYQEQVCAFLCDALSAPDVETSPGFPAAIDRLVTAGRVATSSLGERTQTGLPQDADGLRGVNGLRTGRPPACPSSERDDTL